LLDAQVERNGDPTAEGIARLLQISVRTLARKLEDLAEGVSIKEVAKRLGFADASAFRRWHGRSPSDYRRSTTG
jgi:AraC-like DNA-binding protein